MNNIIWWPEFCGNETPYDAFWNGQLTLNSSRPDLTRCLQSTVMVWIPGLFMVIASVVQYVFGNNTESNSKDQPESMLMETLSKDNLVESSCSHQTFVLPKPIEAQISYSLLYRLKIGVGIVTCVWILLTLIKDVYYAVVSQSDPVYLVSSMCQLTAYLIATIMIHINQTRKIHSSGSQFIFLTMQLLCGCIIVRSTVLQGEQGHPLNIYHKVSIYVYFGLICIQWGLCLLVDKSVISSRNGTNNLSPDETTPLLADERNSESDKDEKHISPEISCSFLSSLFFTWFYRLLVMGWKKSLQFDDLYDIPRDKKCKSLTKTFYQEWNKRMHKAKSDAANSKQEISKPIGPSLFKSIMRSMGVTMLYAMILNLFGSLILFSGPLLLSALLQYIETGNELKWKGYVIAVGLFLCGTMQTLFIHRFLYHAYNFGLKMRSLVTSVVYRKSMKLSGSAMKKTTVGEIVNLMSVDAQKLQDIPPFMCSALALPINISICIALLWRTIGIASLACLVVIGLILPLNAFYITNKIRKLQAKQMGHKDMRIRTVNEVLAGIKVIKLYAWECFFQGEVNRHREKELETIKWVNILNAIAAVAWNCCTYLVSLAVLGTYVLISKDNYLDASKVFVTFSLVNILSFPMSLVSLAIGFLGQALVSLDRIRKFLLLDELDDDSVKVNQYAEHAVDIVNGQFSWGKYDAPTLKSIDMSVKKGELVAVVGEVGSGKSSLISAILGEMYKQEGQVTLSGSVAYVPQQPWIQNATLKDNILFGVPANNQTYKKVIRTCALEPDLQILPHGDMTEIGEKGITLSGGQKQRVSLARAVYQSEDIYLLDDPLSAVDTHVGKHLFEQVIGPSGSLKHKTRILVTHSVTYLPFMDRILVLRNGRIDEAGTYQELLHNNGAFSEFLKIYMNQHDDIEEDEMELDRDVDKSSGSNNSKSGLIRKRTETTGNELTKSQASAEASIKDKFTERQQVKARNLITVETAAEGNVSFAVIKEYLKAGGWLWVSLTFLFHLLFLGAMIGANIWLSEWSADQPKSVMVMNHTQFTQPDNTMVRLGVYAALVIVQVGFVQLGSLGIAIGCYCASRVIHFKLVARLLRAPMRFFDTTPLGRVINRCSKDIDYVDVNIPFITRNWMYTTVPLFATIVIVSYSTPIFLAAVVPIGVVYVVFQRIYIATTRQLKRIDAIKRSPVFVHFDESIVGASSIRAYKRQHEFINKCDSLTDDSQRAWYLILMSMRWLGVSMESLGNLITFLAAMFAVLQNTNSSLAGLSVSYALQIALYMNFFVRGSSELETYLVAVERIKEYSEIEMEAEWDNSETQPPVDWPSKGNVQYSEYSTRYRPGLSPVLNSISFNIHSKEKVGIVGRTGAGKSSLALSLFRIMEASTGSITIDGIDISKLGLHQLRSKITVIPQDPVIFCGTLRSNLDPLNQHNDIDLWRCLELAHLKQFVTAVGLEHECGEGGSTLSVGQRQLVCLARALLRSTSILMLDEATSGVDLETDDLIQDTIRTAFTESTIITIAHRLNTVMDYDRIMVMDKGNIVEFNSPHSLLQDTNSVFYSMAKDAKLI